MGLKAILLLVISILVPLLTAYWFPTIKFICLELLPSLCSVLLNYDYKLLITPRNLFLLLNLIILILFTSLHLQQQHPPARHKRRRKHRDLQQALRPVVFQEEYSAGGGAESMVYSEAAEAHGGESPGTCVNSRELEAIDEQARLPGEEAAESCDMVSTTGDTEIINDYQSAGLALRDVISDDRSAGLAPEGVIRDGITEDESAGLALADVIDGDQSAGLADAIKDYDPANDAIVLEESGKLRLINPHRPLPSSRFASRRASHASLAGDNPNPHRNHHHYHHHNQAKGSLLRTVSRRSKKSDTLDATWKAINDDSSAANHDHNHAIKSSKVDFKPNYHPNKIRRREPSITHEELNAKVESFISKFNEQIRIQRQESLLTYMQMVERGA